jgi:hypothetical protein
VPTNFHRSVRESIRPAARHDSPARIDRLTKVATDLYRRDIRKHRLLTELLDQVIEPPASLGIVTG